MANYEQVKPFYFKDMGKAKGLCLQNVAKGYHIYPSPDPSGSAKADMERNKKKGTLHSVNELPKNCAVPVYQDTYSKDEHIMVYDKGNWYSDGRKINAPDYKTIFGWGEWCNGYQIVKKVSSGFLPAKGYWQKGDVDKRIDTLCKFYADNFWGYFCKTKAKAHQLLDGPIFGNNCEKWTKEFQRRVGLVPDGYVGKLTYAALKKYGFKG